MMHCRQSSEDKHCFLCVHSEMLMYFSLIWSSALVSLYCAATECQSWSEKRKPGRWEFLMICCLKSKMVFWITGTLTQNEMVFKRLHLGTVSYGTDTMDEIQSHIVQSYALVSLTLQSKIRVRKEVYCQVFYRCMNVANIWWNKLKS